MTLANMLTMSRVILTLGFIFFIRQGGLVSILVATVLFILASLTDYYDGYFAKKRNQISSFGKIMDPIADKFLILSAFFLFTQMDIIDAWMFWVIALREVLLTGFRLAAIVHGQILAAERAGKNKTMLQITSISFILAYLLCRELNLSSFWNSTSLANFYHFLTTLIYILMLLTVGITLYSGAQYLWNNRQALLKFFEAKPE